MQHLSHKKNSLLTIAQSQLIVSRCYISVYFRVQDYLFMSCTRIASVETIALLVTPNIDGLLQQM